MAPSYRSIEERDAGREAMFERAANDRAEMKAGQINQDRENQLMAEQDNLDTIAQAKESGFRKGHSAATVDATRFFADQGFIPGEIADVTQMQFDQENAMEEQSGLGMQEEAQGGALEAQADDISTRLLEAAMRGAPDEVINQTLDQLQVPDQVKSAAAQMFLSKKSDVGSQQGTEQQDPRSQLVKAQPTEITQRAQMIDQETTQRMEQLHALLNPQPQEGQQQQ